MRNNTRWDLRKNLLNDILSRPDEGINNFLKTDSANVGNGAQKNQSRCCPVDGAATHGPEIQLEVVFYFHSYRKNRKTTRHNERHDGETWHNENYF